MKYMSLCSLLLLSGSLYALRRNDLGCTWGNQHGEYVVGGSQERCYGNDLGRLNDVRTIVWGLYVGQYPNPSLTYSNLHRNFPETRRIRADNIWAYAHMFRAMTEGELATPGIRPEMPCFCRD